EGGRRSRPVGAAHAGRDGDGTGVHLPSAERRGHRRFGRSDEDRRASSGLPEARRLPRPHPAREPESDRGAGPARLRLARRRARHRRSGRH
ncbi:MAG: Acetyl-CoA synthetase (ADP-forming) alpha and beta chains, putative, partial [uncultured Craurococcus sp.]